MNHLARAAAWGREEFSLSEQGQLLVCGIVGAYFTLQDPSDQGLADCFYFYFIEPDHLFQASSHTS